MSEVLRIPDGLNPASYAVADAMMVVQARFMTSPPRWTRSAEDLDKALEKKSHAECEAACARAISYLALKHASLFQAVGIMRTFPDDLRDVRGIPMVFHDNFIALDTSNIWYAGSPANHKAGVAETRMTNVISSSSLPEVLKELKEQDKAEQPTPELISRVFVHDDFRMPRQDERSKSKKLKAVRFERFNTLSVIQTVRHKFL